MQNMLAWSIPSTRLQWAGSGHTNKHQYILLFLLTGPVFRSQSRLGQKVVEVLFTGQMISLLTKPQYQRSANYMRQGCKS